MEISPINFWIRSKCSSSNSHFAVLSSVFEQRDFTQLCERTKIKIIFVLRNTFRNRRWICDCFIVNDCFFWYVFNVALGIFFETCNAPSPQNIKIISCGTVSLNVQCVCVVSRHFSRFAIEFIRNNFWGLINNCGWFVFNNCKLSPQSCPIFKTRGTGCFCGAFCHDILLNLFCGKNGNVLFFVFQKLLAIVVEETRKTHLWNDRRFCQIHFQIFLDCWAVFSEIVLWPT